MACKTIRQYLRDYRQGKLSADLHDLVDQHLAECPECRAALQEDESVSDFLESLQAPDSDESFTELLMKRLDNIEKEKRSGTVFTAVSSRVWWMLLLSMIILFFVIGFLVFSFESEMDQYYTTYGNVGYTWMGPTGETLDAMFESDSSDSFGGGSLAALAGSDPDKPAKKMTPEDGRIVHTFDFSDETDSPVTSEFQIEEK
ncbi:zf-HC2 domain-containing protein [bacterium]|nr:zf-HC2 domain-containing protein [candidate division CSSED10-310 bacterium]